MKQVIAYMSIDGEIHATAEKAKEADRDHMIDDARRILSELHFNRENKTEKQIKVAIRKVERILTQTII